MSRLYIKIKPELNRGLQREWLYWFDERGNRILTPEELLARYQEQFGELPEK